MKNLNTKLILIVVILLIINFILDISRLKLISNHSRLLNKSAKIETMQTEMLLDVVKLAENISRIKGLN